MFIEAYLRRYEDALRVKASESEERNIELPGAISSAGLLASILNTGLSVPAGLSVPPLNVGLSVPAFNTGFSAPKLSKIPHSQLLFAIRQASANAAILFPKGLANGIQIEESDMPPRTLALIALSPLSLWVHAALADALTGGKPDVFFDLIAQTLRDLTKPDESFTMLSYVTATHEATIELVREAYESHKKDGTPQPWKVLGIPTFMPTKLEVKRKAVAMFGKLVPDIRRKKNPQTGRYESRDQLWTRIFAIAGLRALIDSRGQHLRKR
jgi:hypothetical protein